MRLHLISILLCALGFTDAHAATPFILPNAVDPAVLDAVRGGFAYGDNLLVTLGIDRLVQVNGNIVEQHSVQFGDVGKLASGQVQLSGDALGTRLIQNGQPAGMVFELPGGALGGTVIQNSLNDQLISNQTTIRASVNNAGVLQTMNFNASLSQALNHAISPR